MAEATITTAGVSAVSLTLLGVSTGLDPAVLIAGFAGGVWAQSYGTPAPYLNRVLASLLASLIAGYFAPALSAAATASSLIQGVFPGTVLQLPIAVAVGLLAHRVLGPAIMRLARKKSEDLTK